MVRRDIAQHNCAPGCKGCTAMRMRENHRRGTGKYAGVGQSEAVRDVRLARYVKQQDKYLIAAFGGRRTRSSPWWKGGDAGDPGVAQAGEARGVRRLRWWWGRPSCRRPANLSDEHMRSAGRDIPHSCRYRANGCGPRWASSDKEGAVQPGPQSKEDARGEPMMGEETTWYRAMVARCNLMGCDRPCDGCRRQATAILKHSLGYEKCQRRNPDSCTDIPSPRVDRGCCAHRMFRDQT